MRVVRTFVLLLVIGSAQAEEQPSCTPLEQWQEVPAGIREDLETLIGPIAEEGARFNATDVVSGDLASNRFLTACRSSDLVAVALERGGRGYHIEVFQFREGQLATRWTQLLDQDGKAEINLLQAPDAR
ncbi:hypothetical protein [Pseudoxanthomonas indica]|nr:hypothetical protein [Pseudoxanthomonas indica]